MTRYAGQGLNLSDFEIGSNASGGAGAAGQASAGETFAAFRGKAPKYGDTQSLGMEAKSAVRRAETQGMADLLSTEIITDAKVESDRMLAEAEKNAAQQAASSSMMGSALGLVGSIGGALLSDERSKENIEAIDNALATLRQLKPVTYNYNSKYSTSPERLHHGFIAQDYKEVMPDATYFDESKQLYCIDTSGLIALLVQSVQELDQRLSRHEAMTALKQAQTSILGDK